MHHVIQDNSFDLYFNQLQVQQSSACRQSDYQPIQWHNYIWEVTINIKGNKNHNYLLSNSYNA